MVQEKCRLEVEELKDENYGYELCQAIGRTYKAKAEHYTVCPCCMPYCIRAVGLSASGIIPIRASWLVPWCQKHFQHCFGHVSTLIPVLVPAVRAAYPMGTYASEKGRKVLTIISMSTLKSAIELKQVFDRLQLAEQSGISPAEMRKLEEQAAEQGLRTMWKVRTL